MKYIKKKTSEEFGNVLMTSQKADYEPLPSNTVRTLILSRNGGAGKTTVIQILEGIMIQSSKGKF